MTVLLPRTIEPALDAAIASHGNGEIAGPRAAVLGQFLLSLADFLPHAAGGDLVCLTEALRSMLLAALAPDCDATGSAPGSPKSRLRARVDSVIAQNIGSARLDAERIAQLAGVSRATLYRLFEGAEGVAGHVRRLRLERVRADLCNPALGSVPIAALAERSGFHCVTSFNRSFRRSYGTTPGEMRLAAAAPGAPEGAIPKIPACPARKQSGDGR